MQKSKTEKIEGFAVPRPLKTNLPSTAGKLVTKTWITTFPKLEKTFRLPSVARQMPTTFARIEFSAKHEKVRVRTKRNRKLHTLPRSKNGENDLICAAKKTQLELSASELVDTNNTNRNCKTRADNMGWKIVRMCPQSLKKFDNENAENMHCRVATLRTRKNPRLFWTKLRNRLQA